MLYIHIPYCRRKCLYCDFFSGGARIAEWQTLSRALLNELSDRIEELPHILDSIYIGGGTPSLMPPEMFAGLVKGLRESLTASGSSLSGNPEFTIEVNPEDVDEEHVDVWLEAGVNRVSVGIQTFDDSLLKSIGRSHSGVMAEEALRKLKREFGNVSGDLIFGIPGQTVEQLEQDVRKIAALDPQHVSVYSMMYEEGTALTALRDAGRIEETDDDTVNRQYELLTAILSEAGYEHYEISNYAKPGFRSRHNSGYWTGKPYLGLGPSAHSFDGSAIRRANPADLRAYLTRYIERNPSSPNRPDGKKGETLSSFFTEERLTPDELREERIMLSLRRTEGIDLKQYKKDFGTMASAYLQNRATPHLANGNLLHKEGHLTLSRQGIMLADTIIVDLL